MSKTKHISVRLDEQTLVALDAAPGANLSEKIRALAQQKGILTEMVSAINSRLDFIAANAQSSAPEPAQNMAQSDNVSVQEFRAVLSQLFMMFAPLFMGVEKPGMLQGQNYNQQAAAIAKRIKTGEL